MGARRLRRTRRGDFEVRLPEEERALLSALVPQLRQVLHADAGAGSDPQLRRLYPAAYPDDPEQDRDYRGLVADDLLARRLRALETLEATVSSTRLQEAELEAWMGAVNDLRLVLGTRLDVSEESDLEVDPDHPEAASLAVYGYLGFLLETIVAALGGR